MTAVKTVTNSDVSKVFQILRSKKILDYLNTRLF